MRLLLLLSCLLNSHTNRLLAQALATDLIAPADWKEKGLVIRLKDDLNHPQLAWPVTLLQYRIDFGASGAAKDKLALLDEATGKPVPFQLTDIVEVNQLVQKATLCFLSHLPSGGDKRFRLVATVKKPVATRNQDLPVVKVRKNDESILLSNGLVQVEIPAANAGKRMAPILRFGKAGSWLGRGEIPASLKMVQLTVTEKDTGPLLAHYTLQYDFEGGKHYQATIKLVAGMEFVELEEEMTGFAAADSAAWRLVWEGIRPQYRYCPNRADQVIDSKKKGYENIVWEPLSGTGGSASAQKHPQLPFDQQSGPGGRLPFSIAAYDNWISWWRLPTAAFWNEKQNTTIGLFIKDTEKWNDGTYPVWGSKPDLSISFHVKDSILDYRFPLVSGSRSTALATYAHDKDIARVNATHVPLLHIDYLRRWYGWVSLDKVKEWVLDYEAPLLTYPRYFKPEHATARMTLADLESRLANELSQVATGSERSKGPNPVGAREFYEYITPLFDLHANTMNPARRKRLRARYLFMNYVCMDEALMPVRTLLSGHPNFLADIKGVPGTSAFLFPDHPQAGQMADHFEKSIALNFNYHVRPEVGAWDARGGRWTENLSCYTWAHLQPTVRTSYLLHHYFDGRNRILQPGVSMHAAWLLNALTSPLQAAASKRVYPPQGAHAHGVAPPDVFRLLGQELFYYNPLLAEHLFWVTSAQDLPFEADKVKTRFWSDLLKGKWENNRGTNPHLRSAKYTGYGVVLRSGFASANEMYVHLQQIDEGPNYRWGRAGKGGNGVIYYYAQGKRYSHNGIEDVGDGPFGDVERCTNFGVKKAAGYRAIGPYRSVGRHDLSEPLYDFDFAQLASIKANGEAAPDYHSRSVLQSGADYIVVFDEVANEAVEGRFSWFVGTEDDFPAIHQVTPGAVGLDAGIKPSKSLYHTDPAVLPIKGRYYDGKGNFLTVVTHKPGIKVIRTSYGCEVVKEGGSAEKVFRSSTRQVYAKNGTCFTGTAGIIQQSATQKDYAAALFSGTTVGIPGMVIELAENNQAGLSCQASRNGYQGKFQSTQAVKLIFTLTKKSKNAFTFYLNGHVVENPSAGKNKMTIEVPAGKHTWQWTAGGVVPDPSIIVKSTVKNQGAVIEWNGVSGATHYQLQMSKDGGLTWANAATTALETTAAISGLENDTKIHVRVIAKGPGGVGEPSAEYPVYITDQVPHAPEGLLVNPNGAEIKITWGEILGAPTYHLYRREKKAEAPTDKLIYSGSEQIFMDKQPGEGQVYEYRVTAVNGNGESKKSTASDTDRSRFLNWEPKPGEGFRRDTESHENGFAEFNPFVEMTRPVLSYPTLEKEKPHAPFKP